MFRTRSTVTAGVALAASVALAAAAIQLTTSAPAMKITASSVRAAAPVSATGAVRLRPGQSTVLATTEIRGKQLVVTAKLSGDPAATQAHLTAMVAHGARSRGGCNWAWAEEDYTWAGFHVAKYEMSVRFCWNASRKLTSMDHWIDGPNPSYPAGYDGILGETQWSVHGNNEWEIWTRGKFEFCFAEPLGCFGHRYPQLWIEVWGGGGWGAQAQA